MIVSDFTKWSKLPRYLFITQALPNITKLVKTTITDTDSDWTALTVNLIKNLSFSCSQIARIIESLEIARLQSLDGVIIHSRTP